MSLGGQLSTEKQRDGLGGLSASAPAGSDLGFGVQARASAARVSGVQASRSLGFGARASAAKISGVQASRRLVEFAAARAGGKGLRGHPTSASREERRRSWTEVSGASGLAGLGFGAAKGWSGFKQASKRMKTWSRAEETSKYLGWGEGCQRFVRNDGDDRGWMHAGRRVSRDGAIVEQSLPCLTKFRFD
eukprot:9466135-Pyramimonas_sp.AAC.4